MKAIQAAIEELTGEITKLTTARDALTALNLGGDTVPLPPAAVTRRGSAPAALKKKIPKAESGKRKVETTGQRRGLAAVEAPPAAGMAGEAALEKPDTVAGAMKHCARKLKKFTVSELLDALKADADFKKLLEAGNPTSPYSSVAYWAQTGKLKKEGDGAAAVYSVVNLDF